MNRFAVFSLRIGGEAVGGNAVPAELLGHVLGVGDADAEPQAACLMGIKEDVAGLFDHQGRAQVVAGVDALVPSR